MKHVVIVGGRAALATPLITYYTGRGDKVTAVCRVKTASDPPLRFGQVAQPSDVEGLVDLVITLTGSVNNAKMSGMTYFQWDQVIEDNLSAAGRALLHLLSKVRDGGNVVVVGSVIGSSGGYGCANYAAAKAGLVGLVRAAANEHATRGVCINLLELGYIDAGMGARLDPKIKEKVMPTIPLGRFGTEEDVVDAITYLGRVRYMTGSVLTLAGGLR